MFTLAVILLFVILGLLVLDRRRLRDALPAALTGTILSGAQSAIPGLDSPWHLLEPDPIGNPWLALFLLQITVAPVISTWFVQGLDRKAGLPVGRITLFGLLTWVLEMLYFSAGKLEYSPWWGPLHSLPLCFSYAPVLYLVHTYTTTFGSPHQQWSDRSVREVTQSSVLPAPGSAHVAPGGPDH